MILMEICNFHFYREKYSNLHHFFFSNHLNLDIQIANDVGKNISKFFFLYDFDDFMNEFLRVRLFYIISSFYIIFFTSR